MYKYIAERRTAVALNTKNSSETERIEDFNKKIST